jgi:hypothetical protein
MEMVRANAPILQRALHHYTQIAAVFLRRDYPRMSQMNGDLTAPKVKALPYRRRDTHSSPSALICVICGQMSFTFDARH